MRVLKNIRVTSRVASTTSTGLVRSATTTSAPSSRNRFARPSSRRTITRTGSPLPRSSSTTDSLTLPEAQAAPVIRYMAVNLAADDHGVVDSILTGHVERVERDEDAD